MHANFTQEIHVIQPQQPIRIIRHNRFSIRKINEARHLLLEAGNVVLDFLLGEHFAHIRFAGRIADHARSTAK
jgi:hypothetical protein